MRRFLAVSIFLLLSVPATAGDTRLETVVVTATRTPQPADRTGESITIITAHDLAERQIVVGTDALQDTPGLMINRNGGVGQQSTVSLRGADAGQTVVLIDGVRINDPSATDNTAVLGDLLVNNFDRVEILRGPQSTLYGSDAIGGVINVLTKRGGDTPLSWVLTGEGGSFDTAHLNASANGSTPNIDYGVGLNFYDTRGTSAADRANGNAEADGYLHYGATTNVRVHVGANVSIDLRGYYVRTHTAFDDGFDFKTFLVSDSKANAANQLFAGYTGLNFDLFDGTFRNRIALIGTTSSRKFFDSSFDTIHLNSDDFAQVVRVEYQGIVNPDPDDEITFGIESEHSQFRGDSYSSFGNSTDDGRSRNTGLYLQAQHTLRAQLTVTGGVRYEHDDTFGSHTSFKLAGAWQIPRFDATLRANYGDGFKAPSLFQRFSEFSPPPDQPQLKPETADGWEIGADKPILEAHIVASLTYFERRTHNLVDFVSCPAGDDACFAERPFGFFANVGRVRASGIEANVTTHPADGITVAVNYTNLSTVDLTTNPSEPLQRRPHSKASATLAWSPDKKWNFGVSATYVGPRFDDGTGARVHLSDYLLANLFGSWKLTDQYEVFARVENLFDRHYEPLEGYGAPSRAAFIGLRVRI